MDSQESLESYDSWCLPRSSGNSYNDMETQQTVDYKEEELIKGEKFLQLYRYSTGGQVFKVIRRREFSPTNVNKF